jgi:hypothetical protein
MTFFSKSLGLTLAFSFAGALKLAASSYTLSLYMTANPGGYWADPHGALETVLTNYAPEAKANAATRFWTICLETDEYFWPGSKYNASITGTIANGGGSNTNSGDPISIGSAFLYKEFALGNLDNLMAPYGGFSYNATGGARLQNTIWALENEAGKVADAQLINLLTAVYGAGNYAGNYLGQEVMVMHLTRFDGPGGDGQAGTARQDMLVLKNVPESTATLALLGAAFVGLAIVRRRQN